jgi:D-alanyl-D-alanine carboxypeptidase
MEETTREPVMVPGSAQNPEENEEGADHGADDATTTLRLPPAAVVTDDDGAADGTVRLSDHGPDPEAVVEIDTATLARAAATHRPAPASLPAAPAARAQPDGSPASAQAPEKAAVPAASAGGAGSGSAESVAREAVPAKPPPVDEGEEPAAAPDERQAAGHTAAGAAPTQEAAGHTIVLGVSPTAGDADGAAVPAKTPDHTVALSLRPAVADRKTPAAEARAPAESEGRAKPSAPAAAPGGAPAIPTRPPAAPKAAASPVLAPARPPAPPQAPAAAEDTAAAASPAVPARPPKAPPAPPEPGAAAPAAPAAPAVPADAPAAPPVPRVASEGPPPASEGAAAATPSPAAPAPAPSVRRGSTYVPLRTDGAAPPVPAAAPSPEGPAGPPEPPRSPLELLAALTNKQAPKATPLRGALRRVKIWTPLVLVLGVVLAVAQVLRPLPDPELVITTAESYTFDGELGAVPWPEAGQGALDVDGVGTFGSAGEREAVPIASVAKTMTAYLILREHPMTTDGDGAEIEVDQQAQDDYALGESRGDSVVDVRAGDTISQREALQALMIASGNNVAWLLARWDAGSVEDFVVKMNEAAAELGMDDTVYTDPSGFDLETVSTAADQVKLGRAAMQDPVLRRIVGVSEYEDQYGQTHPNGNTLVPVGGVVGIKTGSRTAAGGNFLFAARQEVDGESRLIVGAVLSQPPHPSDNSIRTAAAQAARTLIDFAQEGLRADQVLSAGDIVGHVDDGLGGQTPLVVAEDVVAVGWDGLKVRLRLAENDAGAPGEAPAGTVVGGLTVGDGDGATEIPVRLQSEASEPGLTDKLFRLG